MDAGSISDLINLPRDRVEKTLKSLEKDRREIAAGTAGRTVVPRSRLFGKGREELELRH